MTPERDFIGLLEDYLDEFEGVTPLPDATREAIRAQLPSTYQRPAWWPGWRFPEMNYTAKLALGAAAVMVASVIGFSYFGRGSNVGGLGEPPPTPTPAPYATLPANGNLLDPGRYEMDVSATDTVLATVSVPAGWTTYGWFIEDGPDKLAFWTVSEVYADACAGGALGTTVPAGSTIDDLVAALDAQVGTDLSESTDVVVGGYEGVRAVLTGSAGLDPATCGDGSFFLWRDAEGAPRSHGGQDALWILDVEGQRVLIDAAYDPARGAIGQAATEMIESVEFSTP